MSSSRTEPLKLSPETAALEPKTKPAIGHYIIVVDRHGNIRYNMPTDDCLKAVRRVADVTVESCLCG